MTHSPEPWHLTDGNDLVDADGNYLETTDNEPDFFYGLSAENIQRIIACVNALAGIDSDLLSYLDRRILFTVLSKLKYDAEQEL